MKRIIIILSCLTWCFQSIFSQTSGIYSDSILFNSTQRKLAYYLPINYNSGTKYRLMICLHGMGDNSDEYCDALINIFKWNHIFTNTIFMCPDGGEDYASNFSSPSGDEEIVQTCLNYAKQHFSIDSTNIILQGFSLGGRSALKYGLDNPTKFKGLLLNTPAVQGLDDALNKLGSGPYYNYANGSKIPIYVLCGEYDDTYSYIIPPMIEQLIYNNTPVKYVIASGIDHVVTPDSSITYACIPFFENPTPTNYDIDIFKFKINDRYCDTTLTPQFYIRNTGKETITELSFTYFVNGTTNRFSWKGQLQSYKHALISLPELRGIAGINYLQVKIDSINHIFDNILDNNDSLSKTFYIQNAGISLPISEGFENEDTSWIFPVTGSLLKWYKDTNVYRSGTTSMNNFNSRFIFYTLGDIESFLSPVLDLTKSQHPKMAFDYAYNYHKYTTPYFTKDTIFADTLEVSISFDCGETFQQLFKKGGIDLATTSEPIINPLNIDQGYFIPNKNEWKTQIIDLESYANEENAIIKFSYISGMGGCINIDNILFAIDAPVNEIPNKNTMMLYPNPVANTLYLSYSENDIQCIEIYDITGKTIQRITKPNNKTAINVSSLNKGVYLIQIQTSEKTINQKFIKY